MGMFGSSFGKVNKHKRFEYKPLYYSPDKDKLQQGEDDEDKFNFRKAYAREKGKASPLAAFYSRRGADDSPSSRRSARIKKMVLLLLMFFIVYMIFGVGVHFYAEITGMCIMFVMMVIFIREVNNG